MEWEKANACEPAEESGDAGEVLGYVKVMTNDQMEALQKQISIYATICEQLVEMHRASTEHQGSIAGTRLGNLYCDPLMVHGGHRISARQRWTPTQMQLQILESILDQGNGTPSKQKIKDITVELSQHGQISETNVYNWFQNRRPCSKRKQSSSLPNHAESDAVADEECPISDKKPKPDGPHGQNKVMRVQNPEEMMCHHLDREHGQTHSTMYGSNNDNGSRSSGGLGQMTL